MQDGDQHAGVVGEQSLYDRNYCDLAVDVRARLSIINSIAVADVEAGLGAIPPSHAGRTRETAAEIRD
jgi:hypothetical protein